MPKIAYILLCHEDPDAIIEQAQYLTQSGDYIAIHFDKRSPDSAYRKIRSALVGMPNAALCQKRVKCAWGGWSLVQATLNTLRTGLAALAAAFKSECFSESSSLRRRLVFHPSAA